MQINPLDHLAAAYFHQDFDLDYGGTWGAVAAFVEHEPDLARRLPAEIRRVLAADSTESELRDHLLRVGCYYVPSATEGGYRGWLTAVADRVEAATS